MRAAALLLFPMLLTACGQHALAVPANGASAQPRTGVPVGAPRPAAVRAKADPRPAPIRQATVQEAAAYLAATPKAQFIDVRMADEYAGGHAKGAALRPLPELAQWADGLKKDQPVVVICRSGSRSMKAATALSERGFTTLVNVQGGTLAWEASGLPLDK